MTYLNNELICQVASSRMLESLLRVQTFSSWDGSHQAPCHVSDPGSDKDFSDIHTSYLSFFFTLAKFLENKIYTEIYTVNYQFTQ